MKLKFKYAFSWGTDKPRNKMYLAELEGLPMFKMERYGASFHVFSTIHGEKRFNIPFMSGGVFQSIADANKYINQIIAI